MLEEANVVFNLFLGERPLGRVGRMRTPPVWVEHAAEALRATQAHSLRFWAEYLPVYIFFYQSSKN
jgi:hypothetical protein